MQELQPYIADELERDHNELKGMKVVLSSQTYGHVDPHCVRDIRSACFHAANHGLTWYGDVSADRMGYSAARNHACEQLVEQCPEADGIMWIDSDIRPPANAITELLWTARRWGLDFLSGVYHHRDGTYNPVLYDWLPSKKRKVKSGFLLTNDYPLGKNAKIGGCGFGFVFTSTKLVQDIQKLKGWKEDEGKWFPDTRDVPGGFGEDLSFCKFAIDAGYQCHVNTDVQLGHTGDPRVITQEDFRRVIAEEKAKLGL
eukprot:GHVR01169029.1.p1 GENE.GHVR01169029.1~~GHVR01169029.1.p1  ORF type:complete len:256 (-),score=38.42 GHVR01169029.1:60-827(-)